MDSRNDSNNDGSGVSRLLRDLRSSVTSSFSKRREGGSDNTAANSELESAKEQLDLLIKHYGFTKKGVKGDDSQYRNFGKWFPLIKEDMVSLAKILDRTQLTEKDLERAIEATNSRLTKVEGYIEAAMLESHGVGNFWLNSVEDTLRGMKTILETAKPLLANRIDDFEGDEELPLLGREDGNLSDAI
ncbi:uncharacterized protein L203_102291 [Cryptococcus depauperatus CBS 7841]|uniref:Uncharacterized protein n=1 Tax=Cryptococcus depauperatus CBS 7841 TaxID=1295531 RepID=A0A1E3IAK9_9TREE|nr:hypothetical protein L203_04747 [Cryptococcus depauperatus CBS 7841]